MRVFNGRMAFVPEGQADSSQARSAWNNATPKSRPVRYGVIRAGVRADSMIGINCGQSYRTLRDGSFEGRFPRHFVPGYDHAVPPGQNTFDRLHCAFFSLSRLLRPHWPHRLGVPILNRFTFR